jgi:hypothetical protein
MPEDMPQNDKAVPTKWRMAFPEPLGIQARIRVPARRAHGSLPSEGGEAEPPARRRRMGYLAWETPPDKPNGCGGELMRRRSLKAIPRSTSSATA